MQSGWLEQFLKKETGSEGEKPAESPGADGVSRRSFLHGGLVTGVAAGMATGATLAGQ